MKAATFQKMMCWQVYPIHPMNLSTKITIAGMTLTYLQLLMVTAALTGIAYRMHLGPFKPAITY